MSRADEITLKLSLFAAAFLGLQIIWLSGAAPESSGTATETVVVDRHKVQEIFSVLAGINDTISDHDERVVRILRAHTDRLERIEEALALQRGESAGNGSGTGGSERTGDCDSECCDGKESQAAEGAPTVTLYTADSSWSCSPCRQQKRLLEQGGLQFEYTTVYGPAEGSSPTGKYPCWSITFPDGRTVNRNGAYSPALLNDWVREYATGVIAEPPDRETSSTSLSPDYYTLEELRDWVHDNYTRSTRWAADVSPRSFVWAHLQDYRHNFLAEQVRGLTQWEALCLHDGAHRGIIRPQRGTAKSLGRTTDRPSLAGSYR